MGSAADALALLRPLRGTGGPVPLNRRRSTPWNGWPAAWVRSGFAIERGGELGQTALAWRARHDGKGIPGGPIQVTAASAAALGASDRPLQPIPAALFVQAVAGVDIEGGGGLRGWLDGKPLAVPLIGLGARRGSAHARARCCTRCARAIARW